MDIRMNSDGVQVVINLISNLSKKAQDAKEIISQSSAYLDLKKVSITGVEDIISQLDSLKAAIICERLTIIKDKADFEAAERTNAAKLFGNNLDIGNMIASVMPSWKSGNNSKLGLSSFGNVEGKKDNTTKKTPKKSSNDLFNRYNVPGITNGVISNGKSMPLFDFIKKRHGNRLSGKNNEGLLAKVEELCTKAGGYYAVTTDNSKKNIKNPKAFDMYTDGVGEPIGTSYDKDSNVIIVDFGGMSGETKNAFSQTINGGSAIYVAYPRGKNDVDDDYPQEKIEEKARIIYEFIEESKNQNENLKDDDYMLVISSYSGGGSVRSPVMTYLINEYYTEGGSYYEEGNELAGRVLILGFEDAAVDKAGEFSSPEGRADVSMERDTELQECVENVGIDCDTIKAVGIQTVEDISFGTAIAAIQEAAAGIATYLSIPCGHTSMAVGCWYWADSLVGQMASELLQ